jgi:FdhD protein
MQLDRAAAEAPGGGPAAAIRDIWRCDAAGCLRPDRDEVACEEPLELRLRGRSVAVTMRTPGHDRELAAGFLLAEGVIAGAADVLRIEPCTSTPEEHAINVTLAPHVAVDFDRLSRHVVSASSCGVCGGASIESVTRRVAPVAANGDVAVRAGTLLAFPAALREAQAAFDRTGGLHAAAVFDVEGNLVVLREDVGRHNAVDKVVGWGLLAGRLPFDRHILMVSGRVSFEIVQKALAARIPIVAAVSAPSTLAVDLAAAGNQTVVGFLRSGRMNVYTHPGRVLQA